MPPPGTSEFDADSASFCGSETEILMYRIPPAPPEHRVEGDDGDGGRPLAAGAKTTSA